jgi:hypothetical protein
VARKPNYGFEKRKKELNRKAKRDAKLQRKEDEEKKPGEVHGTPESRDEGSPPGGDTRGA